MAVRVRLQNERDDSEDDEDDDEPFGDIHTESSDPPSTEHRRDDDLPYAGWMGARHMSALETSTRKEVIAAVTLSEEDGRVTVFTDGRFEASPAKSLMID